MSIHGRLLVKRNQLQHALVHHRHPAHILPTAIIQAEMAVEMTEMTERAERAETVEKTGILEIRERNLVNTASTIESVLNIAAIVTRIRTIEVAAETDLRVRISILNGLDLAVSLHKLLLACLKLVHP